MDANSEDDRSQIPADVVTASAILHRHLARPEDILACKLLSAEEKRSILASWASDKYAVASIPGSCHPPEVRASVRFRDIVEALRSLDRLVHRRGEDSLS